MCHSNPYVYVQIREYVVSVDCGTFGRCANCIWMWLENLKIGGHFGNVSVAGRMILNKFLMRV
jgi:hypothetical protein